MIIILLLVKISYAAFDTAF